MIEQDKLKVFKKRQNYQVEIQQKKKEERRREKEQDSKRCCKRSRERERARE